MGRITGSTTQLSLFLRYDALENVMGSARTSMVRVLIVGTFVFSLLVLLTWLPYSVTNAGHTWDNQNASVKWWSIVLAPFGVGFVGMIMMLRIPLSRRLRVGAPVAAIVGTLFLVMLVVYPLTHNFDTNRHRDSIQRELRPLLEQAGVVDIDAALEAATAASPFDESVTFVGTIRAYLITQYLWGCLGGALFWLGRSHCELRSSPGARHSGPGR